MRGWLWHVDAVVVESNGSKYEKSLRHSGGLVDWVPCLFMVSQALAGDLCSFGILVGVRCVHRANKVNGRRVGGFANNLLFVAWPMVGEYMKPNGHFESIVKFSGNIGILFGFLDLSPSGARLFFCSFWTRASDGHQTVEKIVLEIE